jgi:hypothetical protein
MVQSQPEHNGSRDPISKKKNPSQKRAGGVAQGVGPEFKLTCIIKHNIIAKAQIMK